MVRQEINVNVQDVSSSRHSLEPPRPLSALKNPSAAILHGRLHRMSGKDLEYVRACHQRQPLDVEAFKALINSANPDPGMRKAAFDFLDRL
jgi:hypothetical protein